MIFFGEPCLDTEYHVAEPPHRPSPYSRASDHLPQQEINNNQRQKSTENAYSSNKTLQRFPGSYGSSARHDSTSDESESGSLCKVENNAVPQNWTDTSPRELSQDVDDERDVDMPYVIGQLKLENKLYSKPLFLRRASTFSEKSIEKLPRKSNLKRALSKVGKKSLRSLSSVIYKEIGL